LAEKTDRLYRNFRDALTLEDLDISINFVKENEWISKDSKSQSKLMHDIRLAMAQNYSEDLREEVKIAGSIAVKIHRISARVAL